MRAGVVELLLAALFKLLPFVDPLKLLLIELGFLGWHLLAALGNHLLLARVLLLRLMLGDWWTVDGVHLLKFWRRLILKRRPLLYLLLLLLM